MATPAYTELNTRTITPLHLYFNDSHVKNNCMDLGLYRITRSMESLYSFKCYTLDNITYLWFCRTAGIFPTYRPYELTGLLAGSNGSFFFSYILNTYNKIISLVYLTDQSVANKTSLLLGFTYSYMAHSNYCTASITCIDACHVPC